MNPDWMCEFKEQSRFRILENPPRVQRCLSLLSEEQVWLRAEASIPSIGNLLLHLCGNVRQYVISGLGEGEDARQRDAEFEARGGCTKAELYARFEQTLLQAVAVIDRATEEQWLRPRSVQGFTLSGLGMVLHAVEHLSYHVGQIALHTKLFSQGQDLGFYAGMDLNQK